MILAADIGLHSGWAAPSLREGQYRQFKKATGRRSTYLLPIPVQTNRASSQEARRLAGLFDSLPATVTVLLAEERRINSRAWSAYHAGVAAGIAHRNAEANEMFARVANGFAQPDSHLAQLARRMALLVDQPEHLREEVASLIAAHRSALRLPALPNAPF